MSILNSDAINDDRQPVISDFSVASGTLFVTFGGVAAGLGIPPFEFFRTIAQIPTKRMLLRDLEQVWYHRGLPGISTNIRETADYLKREIDHQRVTRSVFVGNSMGGYAAILFGWLVEADVVHAFSPQTFLDPFHRCITLERRWRADIRRMYRLPGVTNEFFDLRHVLAAEPRRTQVYLHFAKRHRMDRHYSRRLRGFPNIHLRSYPARNHNLVKHLRNVNQLREILCQSLVTETSAKQAA